MVDGVSFVPLSMPFVPLKGTSQAVRSAPL